MKKNFYYLLVSFFIIFFGINNVFAFSEIENQSDNIFITCNNETKCIPLCVYKPPSEIINAVFQNYSKCIIGYYYDTDDTFKIWEIGCSYADYNGFNALDQTHIYKYVNSSQIPFKNIYSGDVFKADPSNPEPTKVEWNTTDLYKEFSNSLICPKSARSSKGNDGIDLSGDDLTSLVYSPNVYSFVDDYTTIAEQAYNSLITPVSSNDVNSSNNLRIEFLSKFDSKISYDSSLDADTNVKNNCKYISSYASSSSGLVDSYIDNVILSKDNVNKYVNDYIDHSLQKFSDGNNYNNVYKYSNLKKLMVTDYNNDSSPIYRNVSVNNGRSVFERIDRSFGYNVVNALNSMIDVCSSTGSGFDFKPYNNLDEVYEAVQKKYVSKVYTDLNFDPNAQLDCSNFFDSETSKFIKNAYFYLEILAALIIIGLTAKDYAVSILNSNQDEMKKSSSRLLTRIILLVVILVLPAIIKLVINLFNIEGFNYKDPLCEAVEVTE